MAMKAWAAMCLVLRIFAMGSVSHSALASPASAKLDAELRAIVNDERHPLASLSVLAVRDAKVVYQAQIGWKFIDANDAAKNRPADADTLYRIASISKLVTTLGALRLVEEGKLALDKDISKYLGFVLRNPHFPDDPITVRMLLSHTSSLRDDAGYSWASTTALKEVLLPGGPLHGAGAMWARDAKPGAHFQYANLPWGVLATVMERVTGERFDRLMRRLILDPMGLVGGFNPAEFTRGQLANVATLYRKRTESGGKENWNLSGPWVPQVDDYSMEAPVPRAGSTYVQGTNGTAFGPQGNLRLSAEGLAKIMLMLMNSGRHDGKQILQAATVKLMLSQHWRDDREDKIGHTETGSVGPRFYAWGLGNQHFLDLSGPGTGDRLVEGGGFKAVGHLGDAWGLTAAFVFDPMTRNGMIFLTGGPGFDPATHKGRYSSLARHEERILTALFQHAILGAAE